MFAAEPWRYQLHPEVWGLILAIIALGGYATRVIGPKVVAPGEPVVTRRQVRAFVAATGLLWLAADWPMHDIAEQYLYSIHMIQHMLIVFVVPPLFMLATPEWLARLVFLEGGRLSAVLRFLTTPILAGIVFNGLQALTHWEAVVNLNSENGTFHYFMHLALFTSALLAWSLIVSPLPELRLKPAGQMLFLFSMSIIPTVPAGWLTFADKAVYSTYDYPDRIWGVSAPTDQQAAGIIMKMIGGLYLWNLNTIIWGNWTAQHRNTDQRTIVRTRPLTYDEVNAAFEETPAPDAPATRP